MLCIDDISPGYVSAMMNEYWVVFVRIGKVVST